MLLVLVDTLKSSQPRSVIRGPPRREPPHLIWNLGGPLRQEQGYQILPLSQYFYCKAHAGEEVRGGCKQRYPRCLAAKPLSPSI